jgi:NAD(P)-dependent dehydrogenase (short-subunit alcohol dehydrogenase family)
VERQHHQDPREAKRKPPFDANEQEQPGSEAEMGVAPDFGEKSYTGLGRLKGRVALITGGDSGIGRAVALAFAREGADVAFQYLDEHDDADKTVEVVREAGRKVHSCATDLDSEEGCRRVVDVAVKAFGRIDILVNNAAYQGKAVEEFEELDAGRVEKTFRVNVVAMYHLVRLALPHMSEGGTIVNVASIQAYAPSPEILDYAGTKGAIVTFTKGLAQALIERGIRVNCVAPGPVWTPLIQASFPADKVETFGEDSPMGRPAQPVELSPLFVFLASDESRYENGEILGATGGKPLA